MNINTAEIQALAQAAKDNPYDPVALNDYGMAMAPAVTLELLARLAAAESASRPVDLANFDWDAEMTSIRKDAERYRWLRDLAGSQDLRYPLTGKPDEIDATVDAARAAATVAPAENPDSEVFAWLYTKESNGAVMIYRMKQHYPGNWVENDGYTITPLYTGPVNGEPAGWAYRVKLGDSVATWRVSLTEPAYSGDPGDLEVIALYKRAPAAVEPPRPAVTIGRAPI